MEWAIVWIACGFFAAAIASGKGRSFGGWFVLGFLFGPIALLASGFMPKVEVDSGVSATIAITPSERKCPFCAETIKAEAVVCKHCGKDVEPLPKQEIFCPHCGNKAGDNPAACAYCGKDTRVLPEAPGALHCPHCGRAVGSNQHRCQYCERDTGY